MRNNLLTGVTCIAVFRVFTALCRNAVLLVSLLISYPAFSAGGELNLSTELKAHLNGLDAVETDAFSNGPISSQALLDQRVVLVTFFASWCPPCLDEFSALNQAQDELGSENITIVAVNVFEEFDDNDEARMAKFLQTTRPQFTVLKGSEKTRELFGNINRIPTLILFDRKGHQAFNFVHARGADKKSAETEELLNAIRPLL